MLRDIVMEPNRVEPVEGALFAVNMLVATASGGTYVATLWDWTAAAGLGATVLPCFVGDQNRDLVRIGGIVPELDVDLWLLTHADLRHSARVRAFIDFAGTELSYARNLIEGVAAVEAA